VTEFDEATTNTRHSEMRKAPKGANLSFRSVPKTDEQNLSHSPAANPWSGDIHSMVSRTQLRHRARSDENIFAISES